jgi:hypothetical protein
MTNAVGTRLPRMSPATALASAEPAIPAERDAGARTGKPDAAFAAELREMNLRHLAWLSLVGLVVIAGTFALNLLHPIPLAGDVDRINTTLTACGVITIGLSRYLRLRPEERRASDFFILAATALLLGTMNLYFFAMLPAYGQTSIYVIGMVIVALLIRLRPRTLLALLLTNHAVFLAVLLSQDLDIALTAPAATDNTAMMMIAGLAGWLLYRAQDENFRKARVITERTAELHTQNLELARLHRLELDEKLAARLGEEKARLEVLRYQLNPHFLFNALTSIRAQLPASLAVARETIERLTDFCQLTLFRPETDEHPTLGEETKLLRAYLDIEQLRWGELLRVELDVAPDVGHHRIPSLLLLPLVENALKYGRATATGATTIRLAARAFDARTLVIEVANSGDWGAAPHAPAPPSLGIGLENLRQRLARYYPGAHAFTTEAKAGWVRVTLRLQLGPPAGPS